MAAERSKSHPVNPISHCMRFQVEKKQKLPGLPPIDTITPHYSPAEGEKAPLSHSLCACITTAAVTLLYVMRLSFMMSTCIMYQKSLYV